MNDNNGNGHKPETVLVSLQDLEALVRRIVREELRDRPSRPPKQRVKRDADQFLTLAQASALIGTPPETIRYWVWQGKLRGFKPGRSVLVRERDLLDLVAANEKR